MNYRCVSRSEKDYSFLCLKRSVVKKSRAKFKKHIAAVFSCEAYWKGSGRLGILEKKSGLIQTARLLR